MTRVNHTQADRSELIWKKGDGLIDATIRIGGMELCVSKGTVDYVNLCRARGHA